MGGGDRMFKTRKQGAIVHASIYFGRVHRTAHRSREDSDCSENLRLRVQVLGRVRGLMSGQTGWEPHRAKRGEGSEKHTRGSENPNRGASGK